MAEERQGPSPEEAHRAAMASAHENAKAKNAGQASAAWQGADEEAKDIGKETAPGANPGAGVGGAIAGAAKTLAPKKQNPSNTSPSAKDMASMREAVSEPLEEVGELNPITYGLTAGPIQGVMHTGGKVPKTGNYTLEEGEYVVPKIEVEKVSKPMKHKFLRTTIEHHDDGSATVHHKHAEGGDKHVKHAVMDLDGIHDSLEEHLRDPEEIEEALEARGIDPEKLEEAISPGIHEKMEETIE